MAALSKKFQRPEGKVTWVVLKSQGYQIRCMKAFERFRGLEIPWDKPLEIQAIAEALVKASRSRKVVKLAAGQFGAPVQIYVKRYNLKTWYGPILRAPRRSRAREEFDLGWALARAGIRTPRPVWLAEEDRILARYSMLATEAIPFAEDVTIRWSNSRSEKERFCLVSALGRYLALLHKKGFFHDDCKATHILMHPNAPPTLDSFYIIDLLGCRFGRKVTAARRARNLYQFLRTFHPKPLKRKAPVFSQEYAKVFFKAYAGTIVEGQHWMERVEKIALARKK